MKISLDAFNPKEESFFKRGIHEKIEVATLEELENYILTNGYEFDSFRLNEGEIKTRPVTQQEYLAGKLVRYTGKNEFYLVKEMLVGQKLDKFNKDLKYDKSPNAVVKFADSTWDRLKNIEVVDFDFKQLNGKVLNRSVMSLELYNELVDQYNKVKQTMSFTGHRPDKLGGYSTEKEYYMKNETMQRLRKILTEEIERYIQEKNIVYFITGGALGLDQLAFWVVHELKKKYPHIRNILAIPFDGFEKRWKPIDKEWYYKMMKLADNIINVELLDEYEVSEEKIDKQKTMSKQDLDRLMAIQKLQKRNEFMTDFSFYTIAVFDGTKGGTRNCVNYASSLDREIRVLNPKDDFEAYTKERMFEVQETLF